MEFLLYLYAQVYRINHDLSINKNQQLMNHLLLYFLFMLSNYIYVYLFLSNQGLKIFYLKYLDHYNFNDLILLMLH